VCGRENEELRLRFRPERVRLLFVGESPPASGRFFYRGDSGLYRAARDLFHEVDLSFEEEDFLSRFQGLGCYLIDLCGVPVDRLDAKSRRELCRSSEEPLGDAIRWFRPERIVSLVRSIERNVVRAASRAGWEGAIVSVPYPGRWARHRERFVEVLQPVVAGLLRDDRYSPQMNTDERG
jgi:hypothetical protein